MGQDFRGAEKWMVSSEKYAKEAGVLLQERDGRLNDCSGLCPEAVRQIQDRKVFCFKNEQV